MMTESPIRISVGRPGSRCGEHFPEEADLRRNVIDDDARRHRPVPRTRLALGHAEVSRSNPARRGGDILPVFGDA
jgi:hypothetical protein